MPVICRSLSLLPTGHRPSTKARFSLSTTVLSQKALFGLETPLRTREGDRMAGTGACL